MKKDVVILCVLMLFFSLYSNAQIPEDVIPNLQTKLSVSLTDIKMKAEGGVKELVVNSNKTWSLSGGKSWFALTKNGNKIHVKVSPNNSESSRSGSFIVKAAAKEIRVTISQKGKSPSTTLKLSSNKINMDSDGGVRNVTISCNKNWSISGGEKWFGLERNGNMLNVNVATNRSQSPRSGYFFVKAGEKKVKVSVYQKGKSVTYYLNSSKSSLNFGFSGGTDHVAINSNAEWSIENTSDWVNAVKEGEAIRISIKENELYTSRACILRIRTNYHSKEIQLFQDAKPKPYINVSSELEEYAALGGSSTIYIDGNVGWNVETPTEAWVTVLRNGNQLNVQVERNNNNVLRMAEVKIRAKEADIMKTITIRQKEAVLSLSSQDLSFDRGQGYRTIEINAEPDWNIEIYPSSWVDLHRENNKLSVNVKKNKKFRTRQSSFTISNGNLYQRVSVSQEGRVFNTLGKKDRRVVGFSVGYVQKSWDVEDGYRSMFWDGVEYVHGVQAGFRIEPLFKYGFGINTGVFYEFYYTEGATDDYHQEHALYIPLHLEYRLNFSRKFQLFFYGGASFDYALADSGSAHIYDYLDRRYNVSYEYGGGMRLWLLQFNFTVSRGLLNMNHNGDFKIKQNKDIMGSITIMF